MDTALQITHMDSAVFAVSCWLPGHNSRSPPPPLTDAQLLVADRAARAIMEAPARGLVRTRHERGWKYVRARNLTCCVRV